MKVVSGPARALRQIGLLFIALVLSAVLSGQRAAGREVRVSLVAKDITQSEAFERLVDSAGLRVVGSFQHDYSQPYDFNLKNVPIKDALARVYTGRDWKLLEDVLVLTSFRSLPLDYPTGCGRFETLLEYAPADALLPELELAFPDLAFTQHPTMNGFFSSGSKSSLLELKRKVAQLDLQGAPPFPEIRRVYKLQFLETDKTLAGLTTKYPAVRVRPEGRFLELEGSLRQVGEALEYLDTTDRLQEEIEVSLNQVARATQTCLLDTEVNVSQTVDCPPDCRGPLQLMGLRHGDLISSQHVRRLADQPEWRITRNGVPTRIVLNLTP